MWALHNLALDGAGGSDPGPWDNDLDRVETCYFDGGDFLVGYDGERLVAMGGLRRIDEATGEIRRMRVHPCFQRQGRGQAVLTALEERARQLGYTRVVLDTSDRQEAARALYKKNDYWET
ncbi:MAG: GNAT family N-acetyltransferase [Gammaproteobacteria bacterium]|nr:GNAT family N-acetyltransferase [Gammaproteobacteria bacterium]